jgi:hypothetical protein
MIENFVCALLAEAAGARLDLSVTMAWHALEVIAHSDQAKEF